LSKDKSVKTVAIVGLGFVGLTLATQVARHHRTHGLEIRPDVVKMLNTGRPHFHETGLTEELQNALASGNFVAHSKASDLPACDIVIFTVGTPLSNGNTNMEMLVRAIESSKTFISNKTLVIIRSTVFIGATSGLVRDTFEQLDISPKIAVCPERTIEGSAILELTSLPQLIGADDSSSLDAAILFFESLGVESIEVLESTKAAEFAKLAANTFRDVSFGLANELAQIGQHHGIDSRRTIKSVNRGYPRASIAIPGLVGGPCLEKDPLILLQNLPHAMTKGSLILNARLAHVGVVDLEMRRLAEKIESEGVVPGRVAGVLVAGLAFKGNPATDDIRGSLAKNVIVSARNHFPSAKVYGSDVLVSDSDARSLGCDAKVDMDEGVAAADVVVVQHDGDQITADLIQALESCTTAKTVLDFWGKIKLVNPRVQVITFGIGRSL